MDLLTALREGGLDAEFRVTGGDHDWGNWAEALPDTLIFADRAFRAALK
jgi:S-formylglutathione hydrolase FrmB